MARHATPASLLQKAQLGFVFSGGNQGLVWLRVVAERMPDSIFHLDDVDLIDAGASGIQVLLKCAGSLARTVERILVLDGDFTPGFGIDFCRMHPRNTIYIGDFTRPPGCSIRQLCLNSSKTVQLSAIILLSRTPASRF